MDVKKEKRRSKRTEHKFNVKINQHKPSEDSTKNTAYAGKAINISKSGICISISEHVNIGDMLEIIFVKPETFHVYNGLGKVVRVSDIDSSNYEIGIDFSEQKKIIL